MIGIEAVKTDDIRKVLRVLNMVEPEGTKNLRNRLKSDLSPIANQVASAVPSVAPLSGLSKANKWGWKVRKGAVSFTPGKSRTNQTSLVSVRVNYGSSGGYPFGAWLGEFVGTYSKGRTASGRALYNRLNEIRPMKGRGGRFAYDRFRQLRPQVVKQATEIINKTMKQLERKLK